VVACAWVLAACSVPKEAGFPEVARSVEQRTGHAIYWNRGGEADREVADVVHAMLRHELTAAEAVQIALLNNPTLEAMYEDLSVAQADLVQAGLLKNPVFSAFFHLPYAGPGEAHGEIGVEQDFLDLFMVPAR
jgi:cobalt-zinc-cadmium efflux system outer membrane protein